MTTALVVDDDPDLRTLLTAVLQRAGYQVQTAADGESGLRAVLEFRPQVALLDWLLPQRSGVEVCRAVREQPSLEGTAVVLVTARDTETDLEWGYACGVDDYVVKPFVAADLLARVARAIERRSADAGGPDRADAAVGPGQPPR